MNELAGLRRAVATDRAALWAMQEAAYEPNRIIAGRLPLPLRWDYGDVLRDWEVWLAEDEGGVAGALILNLRPEDLYIESISVAPRCKGHGLGNRLLDAATLRARVLDRTTLRLLTNELYRANVAWYGRKGFSIERIEDLGDRRIVHMVRHLPTGG